MGTSIDAMLVEIDNGDLQTRYLELGDMAIRHARVPAGSIHMVHADGSIETVRAGEVYYWPPGHTAKTDEPVVFIEVGPIKQMREFNRHVTAIFTAAPTI